MNLQRILFLLADQLLKGAILLALVLLVERLVRKSSPAHRGALILCSIIALALLPATRLAPPYWTWAAPRTPIPTASAGAALPVVKVTGQKTMHFESASLSPRLAISWPDWRLGVLYLWALGAVWQLARIVHGRWQLRRLFSHSRTIRPGNLRACFDRLVPHKNAGSVELRLSAECPVPVTWGVWQSTVLLPREAEEWAPERLEIVLRHELAHIARRDAAARLLAQLICAFHWCNPLAWAAFRQLRLAQEQACDELVLAAGTDPATYAAELVQSVRRLMGGPEPWSAALAMAQPSTLEMRVGAVLEGGRGSSPSTDRSMLAFGPALVLLSLVGGSLAQIGGPEPSGLAPSASAAPAQQQGAIIFAARILEIPTDETPALLSTIMADAGSKSYGLLPPGAAEKLLSSLAGMPHANLLSAPQLMANPGQTGIVEILDKIPVQTESGDEKLIEAGLRCSMNGIYQRDEKGQEEIQLTMDASIHQLRPGAVPPHTEKSFERMELKQTVVRIAAGSSAVFRLSAGAGAPKATWMVISARRASATAEAGTPPTAKASVTLSLPINVTKLDLPAPQSTSVTQIDPFASPPSAPAAPHATLNLTAVKTPATNPPGGPVYTATITAPAPSTGLLAVSLDKVDRPAPAQKEADAAADFAATPIDINADATNFEKGVAVATGNATLKHKDVVIHGDQIRYDPKAKMAHATGNVTLTNASNQTETQDLEYLFLTGELKTTGPTRTTIKDPQAPSSRGR